MTIMLFAGPRGSAAPTTPDTPKVTWHASTTRQVFIEIGLADLFLSNRSRGSISAGTLLAHCWAAPADSSWATWIAHLAELAEHAFSRGLVIHWRQPA